MTRIDFYFNVPNRAGLARRLVAKAWQAGLYTLVYTSNEAVAAEFDLRLWTESQLSFIPHARCGTGVANETSILIGTDPQPLTQADVIINLDNTPPTCMGRFERLIEIVSTDADDRQRARDRYRHYQARGYSIQTHDLEKSNHGAA